MLFMKLSAVIAVLLVFTGCSNQPAVKTGTYKFVKPSFDERGY